MRLNITSIRVLLLTLVTAAVGLAEEAHFGLIGITAFENARLTAYCDGSVVPAPCEITFEFHHITGRILKQATITLQPGTGGYLDLPAAQTGIPGTVQINPCWHVTRGAAFASLEVFDTLSQRTRILINWGDRPVTRAGDVDFALAGITPFDTARLSALCEGDGSVTPSPCDVTFEFHDINGRTLKQSRMTLQPETAGFLDLRLAEVGSTARRAELQACIKVERGTAVGAFAVVDNFTGLTLAQAYPAALAQGQQ
jgi:hypothetical protein